MVVDHAFGEAEAKQLAVGQGLRVEVDSLRSETDQVFANPDGSMTREQFLEPVRVRRGEQWLDVDSTLARQPDGSWGPRVAAVGLGFSAGGSAPAVTMDFRNTRLQLSWPDSLPAPVIDGNTATYPDVFPGVDLQLSAVGTSFTQHLVVKTAEAGRDPRVRALTLKSKVRGGTLVQDGTGYAVNDSQGRALLVGAQPVMWDSKVRPAGSSGDALAAAITRLDDGDRQAPMGLSVASGTLTVRPDTTVLDDPNAVYPVVLDPTTSPAIYNWAMVNKTYPTTSYYNFTDADQGVGYNNFSGVHTKRVFLSFPTSAYNGKSIISATLRAFETYSATCSAGTVYAYLSGDFSSSLTWNTQPAKVLSTNLDGWSTKAGRSDCYPGGKTADWTVTAGVANRVAAKASRSTFVLQGASESTVSSWMRFGGPKNATASYRPSLSVTYNTTPTAPQLSSMWVPNTSTACTASASTAPKVNPSAGASDLMYAKIADPDGDNVSAELQVLKADSTSLSITSFGARATGSTISMYVPSTLVDGSYKFRVRVKDAYVWSGWGPYCYFTVDKTAPPTPLVTSNVWHEGVLAPNSATTGQFTMTSAGATTMLYRWLDDPAPLSSATTTGTVTASATTTKSLHEWRATGRDAAGNTGGTAAFVVKRAQPGKLAEYLFNGRVPSETEPATCTASAPEVTCDTANQQLDSETALTDPDAAAAYQFDLSPVLENFTGDWEGRWATDAANRAVLFDGDPSSAAELPSRPVVGENSFTIGVWAFLGDSTQSRTLLAQERDANPDPATAAMLVYDVGYDATADKFVARLMDQNGAVIATTADSLPAMNPADPAQPLSRAGSWVYLAMVYDAAAQTLRLDTLHAATTNPPDSQFATYTVGATAPVAGTPAVGLGAFRLGAGGSANGDRAGWAGPVDNLAIWQGVPASDTLLRNANYQR